MPHMMACPHCEIDANIPQSCKWKENLYRITLTGNYRVLLKSEQ